MGLINFVLKGVILLLDLRDTYDAFEGVKLDEIGSSERKVVVRNAQDGTKQTTLRRRVGTLKRKAAIKSALVTVFLWNLFNKVEPFCDRTVAWFVPFYDSIKTLFLVWMLFTRSYGASILVYRVLTPIIKPYEPVLDGVFQLSVALFGWTAAVLAPLADHCAALMHSVQDAIGLTAPSTGTGSIPPVATVQVAAESGPKRKSSSSLLAERGNKPPPSAPPSVSIKASPTSASSSSRNPIPRQQSRMSSKKIRQEPIAKVPHPELADTRRVLQELPVPRHPLDSTPPKATTIAAPSRSLSDGTKPASPLVTEHHLNGNDTVVKTELTESNRVASAAALGPPPTPPSGLRNYAFIPGLTPHRSAPTSAMSPTPRFPGGFAFSAAAKQASASTSANPFQAQARVPLTAQMAPLSLSSQIALQPTSQDIMIDTVMTHESVPSANDDRIVPPPNAVANVRKVSSSRSLMGKASKQTAELALAAENGKKRVCPDDDFGEKVHGTGKSTVATYHNKRSKPVAGKATSSKAGAGSAREPTRTQRKTTNGHGPSTAGGVTQRKKLAERSAKRTAHMPASSGSPARSALENSVSAASVDFPTAAARTSPQKKARTIPGNPKGASAKTTAPKASTTTKSRSQSVEASEPSQPPQRLTRSRTKQKLAD